VTAIAWIMGYAAPPAQVVSAPDFSSAFLALDMRGALSLGLAAGDRRHLSSPICSTHSRRSSASRARRVDRCGGRPINLRRA